MDTRFHCVYLLHSLDPGYPYLYYIGYTVNPVRRVRQHNGEIINGARRTHKQGRPWELVLCVSGFCEDRMALQFEYVWQHPTTAAGFRDAVREMTLRAQFQSKGHAIGSDRKYWSGALRGLPFAVGVLHVMLASPIFGVGTALTLHLLQSLIYEECIKVLQAMQLLMPSSDNSLPTSGFLKPIQHRPPLFIIRETTLSDLSSIIPNEGDSYFTCATEKGISTMTSSSALLFLSQQSLDSRKENSLSNGNSNIMVRSPSRSRTHTLPQLNDDHVNISDPMSLITNEVLIEQVFFEGPGLPCTLCGLPLDSLETTMRCPRVYSAQALEESEQQQQVLLCTLRAHISCMAAWFHHQRYLQFIFKKKMDYNNSTTSAHDMLIYNELVSKPFRRELIPTNNLLCPLCQPHLSLWINSSEDERSQVDDLVHTPLKFTCNPNYNEDVIPLHWPVLVQQIKQAVNAVSRYAHVSRHQHMAELVQEQRRRWMANGLLSQEPTKVKRKRNRELDKLHHTPVDSQLLTRVNKRSIIGIDISPVALSINAFTSPNTPQVVEATKIVAPSSRLANDNKDWFLNDDSFVNL